MHWWQICSSSRAESALSTHCKDWLGKQKEGYRRENQIGETKKRRIWDRKRVIKDGNSYERTAFAHRTLWWPETHFPTRGMKSWIVSKRRTRSGLDKGSATLFVSSGQVWPSGQRQGVLLPWGQERRSISYQRLVKIKRRPRERS